MANLNTHVHYMQNIWNGGAASDDTRYSNRIWAHTLKSARSRLLKIKLDKYDHIADSNYSPLCVELELKPFHDCPCLGLTEQCEILRSKKKLPKEITAKWGTTIEVQTLNGKEIDETTIFKNSYAKYSLTNKKPKVAWFISNGYLHILNNRKLKAVVVQGIWEDPEEANSFNVCEDESLPCYKTDNFPIDSELIFPMYQLAAELVKRVSTGLPVDNRNDGRTPENIQAIDPNEER